MIISVVTPKKMPMSLHVITFLSIVASASLPAIVKSPEWTTTSVALILLILLSYIDLELSLTTPIFGDSIFFEVNCDADRSASLQI